MSPSLHTLDGAVVATTARLTIRRWVLADEPALLRVYGDREVARWIDDGEPITADECERWLEVTARNYDARGYGMFAIEDRVTGELAGFGGVVHPGGQPQPEIKYAFSQAYWGRGLATELVAGLLASVGAEQAFPEVVATVAPENTASQRVLEKCGFVFVEQRVDGHGAAELFYRWRADGSQQLDADPD
ncbi:MAG: GNAT family N-acetyltransferase [Pseudomonadota bacterium]